MRGADPTRLYQGEPLTPEASKYIVNPTEEVWNMDASSVSPCRLGQRANAKGSRGLPSLILQRLHRIDQRRPDRLITHRQPRDGERQRADQ